MRHYCTMRDYSFGTIGIFSGFIGEIKRISALNKAKYRESSGIFH